MDFHGAIEGNIRNLPQEVCKYPIPAAKSSPPSLQGGAGLPFPRLRVLADAVPCKYLLLANQPGRDSAPLWIFPSWAVPGSLDAMPGGYLSSIQQLLCCLMTQTPPYPICFRAQPGQEGRKAPNFHLAFPPRGCQSRPDPSQHLPEVTLPTLQLRLRDLQALRRSQPLGKPLPGPGGNDLQLPVALALTAPKAQYPRSGLVRALAALPRF